MFYSLMDEVSTNSSPLIQQLRSLVPEAIVCCIVGRLAVEACKDVLIIFYSLDILTFDACHSGWAYTCENTLSLC